MWRVRVVEGEWVQRVRGVEGEGGAEGEGCDG